MTSPKRQAAMDFNLKVVLERRFRNRIDKLNVKAIREFTASIARWEITPNFYEYEDELRRIIDAQYKLVAGVFTDRINQMVLAEEKETKQLVPVVETKAGDSAIAMLETLAAMSTAKVPVVVSRYLAMQSSVNVGKITSTTRKEAAKALSKARIIVNQSITATEKIELASLSGGMFRTSINGRTSGIVRLNTNIPAESAKLTQIELLSGEEPSLGGVGSNRNKGTKSWANMGDSLVRAGGSDIFNHLTTEQTVPTDKPFIVSGEQLRFPGDSSLGASIANIINCRCSATYDIAKVVRTRKKIKLEGGSVPRIPKLTSTRAEAITEVVDDIPYSEVFKHEKKINLEFQKELKEAWESLPIEIRRLVKEEGLTIHVGETLKHISKEITTMTKHKMNGFYGFYIQRNNAIVLGEKIMRRGGGLIATTEPKRALMHELGHFLDKVFFSRGIGGSDTRTFVPALKSALSKIKTKPEYLTIRKRLGYYINQKRIVRTYSESFAESTASALTKNPKLVSGRSLLFDDEMKDTIQEVKRQIKEYIKSVGK